MDSDTVTEPSDTCRCAIESTRTEARTYSVAPRDGGGWSAWTASFTRLLARLLSSTMQGVMGFDERWPVTIGVFGADSPCEACFWEA